MNMKISHRNLLIILTAVITCCGACHRRQSQSINSEQSQAEQMAPAGGTATAGDTIHFRGTISGNLKIEMTLVRNGERLAGSYFYPKVGKEIALKGTIDSDGNLELKESDETGKGTGVFKGKWKPSVAETELDLAEIEGKWSRPDGSKQTAFTVTEQPITFSGAQRVVPKTIKETNKDAHYTIDAEYPQIEGGDGRFDKFNREVRSLITKDTGAWKAGEASRDADMPVDSAADAGTSDLGIGYDIRYATDDLISVEFGEGGYSRGAAHPTSWSVVFNYDLKNGKKLALGDLFKPKSNYLSAISTYCVKSLKEQSKKKDLGLEDEAIQSGAGPKPDNYKSSAITKKGLWVTFDAYQVGPYVVGPQYVLVPYSVLKDLINPDGPIGFFLK